MTDAGPQRESVRLYASWPPRSVERRRNFRDTFNAYYQQVLHGCNSPACRTPTCATYRKSRSKGPFRPYTVLSARAIASRLLAEDYPARKLCPFLKQAHFPFGVDDSLASPNQSEGPSDSAVQDLPKKQQSRQKRNSVQAKKDRSSLTQTVFDAKSVSHGTQSPDVEQTRATRDLESELHNLAFQRFLGRSDCLRPLTLRELEDNMGNPLAYSQIVCDMLSSSDSLLENFISRTELSDHCVKAWSTDFQLMMRFFYWQHRMDFNLPSVFSSLWEGARRLYISHQKRHESLGDAEAAHVAKIILAALAAFIPLSSSEAWLAVLRLRKSGRISLSAPTDEPPIPPQIVFETLAVLDPLEDEAAHALVKRLCVAIACRVHVKRSEQDETAYCTSDVLVHSLLDSNAIMMERQRQPSGDLLAGLEDQPHKEVWDEPLRLKIVVEWLRGVILREWDGKAEIQKCSAVSGTLELMSRIYNVFGGRFLSPEVFETPYVTERLNALRVPVSWMDFNDDNKVHLLDFPFLFHPSTLVSFFRAINHTSMAKAHREAKINSKLINRLDFPSRESGKGKLGMEDQVRKYTDEVFVLEIRRDNILTDASNQLWRRQKRELVRPLKVCLGEDEGEEGEDHGGIQQEFLRLAATEFLDPKYGTFSTDAATGMSWFQPGSLEPLYKFELFGILTSLAIYNGLTLPFNFPIVFYMKLLNHQPDHIEDILDGWPELAKGLRILKDWSDGDVEDAFCRSYEFSVDVFGTTKSFDMIPRPNSSSSETTSEIPMVTNENRDQYIHDYIHHLTTVSIAPQFDAFAKGFKTVINPRSLSIFTPTALQTLVEGIPDINTHDLEAITRYEGGYHPDHYIILNFWSMVHGWSAGLDPRGRYSREADDAIEIGQAKVRQLLEFVTASDRLPVGGEARVAFVVQKNGVGDERLPSSMTCFGRLLLPEYTSRRVMEEMLERAVDNSKGFGQP